MICHFLEKHTNMKDKWNKLLQFCNTVGLVISNDGKAKDKTIYTHNEKEPTGELKKYVLYTDKEEKKPIPTLLPHESYKYLGTLVNLNLNWTHQTDMTEKKINKQLNFIRHRAFTERQTIIIVNKVLIPAVMYQANIIPFEKGKTRKWDELTTRAIFHKMCLPGVSGRNYLFESIETNGKELISIEKMAKATYVCSVIDNALNAKDNDTRKIAEMKFDTTQEWIKKYAKEANIKINNPK